LSIYDFVGKEIHNPINNGGAPVTQAMFGTPQKLRALHQSLRTRDGTKQETYTLLYYVAGLSTYCGIRGKTILTGFMSGCYLFRYRQGGELRAAHVGTDNTNMQLNTAAKAAWKTVTSDPTVSEIVGFDPANDVSAKLLADATKLGGVIQIMGIWEGNGGMRVGLVSTGREGTMKLVGIEPAPLRPWASIQTDPKMR
jgi:hypothetical protein